MITSAQEQFILSLANKIEGGGVRFISQSSTIKHMDGLTSGEKKGRMSKATASWVIDELKAMAEED